MAGRRGEKLGWIGGWLGGFVWVLILAVVFLVQGRWLEAAVGLLLVAVACLTVVLSSPWRHPKTRYRVLMIPVYALFFLSVAWGVWATEDPRRMGFNSWWALLLVLPVLSPLWTAGSRRWEDGDA
jgi:hypothetical protein